MNWPYLVPRVVRHLLPDGVARLFLLRGFIIEPGLETSNAKAAVLRYLESSETHHVTVSGRRVMVFGYGGRFDIGIALLEAGAQHVVLCDRYAKPDDRNNRLLVQKYNKYLGGDPVHPRPRDEYITLVEKDIREVARARELAPCSLVVSTSVYEHLEDVEGVTDALAQLTTKEGLQVHFVDLRDHFFKYPFEMLHYSEHAWRTWLNPGTNHNRFRVWDYRRVFEQHFRSVVIEILTRDSAAFETARSRLRPEFISGNKQEDEATLIRIIAAEPHVDTK